MAVTYGFYDSLNHDRLYNAQQMSAIFDGIINDGVFMSVGNQFHTVAGTGMQVIVKSGRAWFDSTWTLNDAEYPLSIDAADVLLTRIDAVVLEVNSEVATRANTIKVVKGTPASTPTKPTLTNTATIHQHALAYVTVAKNTTAITNSMIEIVVGKTETPYVTAILQTTDITDLFKKWESDFQIWFETVRSTLDGDVALNLQNQIDALTRSILKDDTKTAMGLPTTAVGDDAFNYLLNRVSNNKLQYCISDVFGPFRFDIHQSNRYKGSKMFGSNFITVASTDTTITIQIYDIINKTFKYNKTLSDIGNLSNGDIEMITDFSTGDFLVYYRKASGYITSTDQYFYFIYNKSTDTYTMSKQGNFPSSVSYIEHFDTLIKGVLIGTAGRSYSSLIMYKISTNNIQTTGLYSYISPSNIPPNINYNDIRQTPFWYNPIFNGTILYASSVTGSSTYYPYKFDYDNLTTTKINDTTYMSYWSLNIFSACTDRYLYGLDYENNDPYDVHFKVIDVNAGSLITDQKVCDGLSSRQERYYNFVPIEYTSTCLKFYFIKNNFTLFITVNLTGIPTIDSIEDITNIITKNNYGFIPCININDDEQSIIVDDRALIDPKYSEYVYMQSGTTISTSVSNRFACTKFIINTKTKETYQFDDYSCFGLLNELICHDDKLPYFFHYTDAKLFKYSPYSIILGGGHV